MLTLELQYAPDRQGEIRGWYLPGIELYGWLSACAFERAGSTKFYLAPRSMTDRTAQGLIALRQRRQDNSTGSTHDHSSSCPAGAIPLVCWREPTGAVELWLPWCTRLMPEIPVAEILTSQTWDDAGRLVWLPPDDAGGERLIRLEADDEVDISVLLKPTVRSSRAASTNWHRPPIAPQLPVRLEGMRISRDLLGPTPFIDEQQSIGGSVDDLMSLDDDGRTTGGGLSSKAGRWFRQNLAKLLMALKKRTPRQPKDASRGSASPVRRLGSRPGARKGKPTSQLGRAGAYIAQRLNGLLADQREKQLSKLLALMARDPDRALKYALPVAPPAAPRGVGQAGSNLSRNDVDFSLSKLFGGGRPADPWDLNAQLQAQLLAAYRQQAEREQAAGRFRRAAYIYGHLMGDLTSAAMMLEKGKFFIEAAALYEHLNSFYDQARCLRSSGQLTEAAVIYERLGNYEYAAQMWQDVGHNEAARIAWEKAYSAALRQCDILKAVDIMEKRLGDAAQAESLLWQQWPDGYQVFDCTQQGFKRLADQGRTRDAHERFSEIVSKAERDKQTLLAKLCAELFNSYPDREFRQRVEDQCRQSIVDHLSVAPSTEFAQRMQILGNLHTDDVLLRRDVRRFEREFKSAERRLQPTRGPERRKLMPLASARLADGTYYAAMMINQQLLTISKSEQSMVCSRYAQLTQGTPVANHCRPELKLWDTDHQPCCFVHRTSDPAIIYIGYLRSHVDGLVLVSPLGGDHYWLMTGIGRERGSLIGVSDDGKQWWWDREKFTLTSHLDGLPKVTDFGALIRARLLMQLHEHGMDDVLPRFNTSQDGHRQVVTHSGQPLIAYFDTVMGVENGEPVELVTLNGLIQWMVPSLPLTVPRLLVATEHALWMVPVVKGSRPELIMNDEQFTHAIFLPGGRVAATTSRELLLFQKGHQSLRLIDRYQLQHPLVVALLSLSAETLGILYNHGTLERYRIT